MPYPCRIAGQLILLENLLKGNLPTSIVDLANLEILDLSQNEIEGSFPDGFTVLDNLRILDLSFNFFTGTLPDTLGDMTSLVEVRLNNNAAGTGTAFGFSGQIPQTVGFLDSLVRFEVSENRLTGTLPTAMGFLANLQILDVSQNPTLGGPVPSDYQNLVALQEFVISGTSISGEIPAEVCQNDLYLEVSCGGADAVSCSCCVCDDP
jgi:Leucine-rich repeat (LRR) protein